MAETGKARKSTVGELHIVKRVDQSSPTLMTFIKNNKLMETGKLDGPQSGERRRSNTSIVELQKVRVSSLKAESEEQRARRAADARLHAR